MNLTCYLKCVLGVVVVVILSGGGICAETFEANLASNTNINKFKLTIDIQRNAISFNLNSKNNGNENSQKIDYVEVNCTTNKHSVLKREKVGKKRKVVIKLTGLEQNTNYNCTGITNKNVTLFEQDLKTKSSQGQSVVHRTSATSQSEALNISISAINPNVNYVEVTWIINTNTDNVPVNTTISCNCDKNITNANFTYHDTLENGTFKINMTNLVANANYSCNSTIFMNGSKGIRSFNFHTKTGIVENLTIGFDKHDTFFVVSWNQKSNVVYQIHIEELNPMHFVREDCKVPTRSKPVLQNVTAPSYNYTKAHPDYAYHIDVTAFDGDNVIGKGEANISSETSVPGPVEDLYLDTKNFVSNGDTLTYNISWNMPCLPNGNISSYNVNFNGEYIPDSQKTHVNTSTVVATEGTTAYNSLLDLRPLYNYIINVTAIFNNVTGQSEQLSLKTPPDPPGPLVVNVTPEDSSMVITWHELKPVGEILNYNLEIISLGAMYEQPTYCAPDNYTYTNIFPNTTTSYTATSLNPYTNYRITMNATNSAGTGENTVVENATSFLAPKPVTNITVHYLNYHKDHCEVKISWNLPCKINGPLNNIFMLLSGNNSLGQDKQNFTIQKNQNLTVNVTYSYRYTIQIWLVLDNNVKGEEQVHYFETPSGLPEAVTSLEVRPGFNSTFNVSWTPPIYEGVKTVNYVIQVQALEPNYTMASSCVKKSHTYSDIIVNNPTTFSIVVLNPIFHHYIYEFSVRAASVRGYGEATIKNVTSFDSAPEAVHIKPVQTQVKPTDDYEAYAIIDFEPSCMLNGPLVNYTLTYHVWNKSKDVSNNTMPINGSYTLSLRPQFTYQYNITTYTEVYKNTSIGKSFDAPAGVPRMNITVQKISMQNSDSTAKVTLKKEYFNEENGPIQFLGLLLANSNDTGGEARTYNKINDWPDHSSDDNMEIRTMLKNPFEVHNELNLVIGDTESCDYSKNYCNRPLEPDRDYYLIVRAYTNDFYKNSPAIHFRTNPLSHLDLILGILFGIIFIALAAFAVFYLRRKQCIKIPMFPTTINTRNPPRQPNVAIRTCYPTDKFAMYYKHLENNRDLIKEQFLMLKQKSAELLETQKMHFAKLPENRRKNRYTNISPFDETRVKLMIDEDDEIGSDYINASYIQGYSGEVEYIATQGPLESTCRDFWKMILQENVSIIVMVSLFIEQDKAKCYRYFPKNHETITFGDDIEVKCSVELHFGIYCIRTLQVKKDNFQTHVTHMQFLEWPDFGVPSGTDDMLQFCYQLRDRINKEDGVMVVHCSAGVGRTGTLIATDILIQAADARKKIDVFATVEDLRKQRMNMVQTEDQYLYIHRLIMEHLHRPKTPEYENNSSPIYENMNIINDITKENHGQKNEVQESRF